jgi:hypothetical protein
MPGIMKDIFTNMANTMPLGEKHNVYMIEFMRRTFSTDRGDLCLMIVLSQCSRDEVLLEKKLGKGFKSFS